MTAREEPNVLPPPVAPEACPRCPAPRDFGMDVAPVVAPKPEACPRCGSTNPDSVQVAPGSDGAWSPCYPNQHPFHYKVGPYPAIPPASATAEGGGERTYLAALYCPACGTRHVDEGEWATRKHHKHLCAKCGFLWRIEPYTFGVPPATPAPSAAAPTEAEVEECAEIAWMAFASGPRASDLDGDAVRWKHVARAVLAHVGRLP